MPRGGHGYLRGGDQPGRYSLNPAYGGYTGTVFGGAGDYALANQPFAYGNWAGESARNTAQSNYGAFPQGMYASGQVAPRQWYQIGNPATGQNTWLQALDVAPSGVIDMSPGANQLIGGTGRDRVNFLGGLNAGVNPVAGAGSGVNPSLAGQWTQVSGLPNLGAFQPNQAFGGGGYRRMLN